MALMATGTPSLVRRRRNCAPKYVSLSRKLLAAIFNAILMGLLVGSRPLPMTLAPLMRLSGHSRSQETKWCSFSHLLMSYPASLTIVVEAGYDMSKWETEHHFFSWLRLCPDNRISGAKVIGKGRLPTNNPLS